MRRPGSQKGAGPCPSVIPAFMEGIPGSCLQRGILRFSARNKEDAPAVLAGPRISCAPRSGTEETRGQNGGSWLTSGRKRARMGGN